MPNAKSTLNRIRAIASINHCPMKKVFDACRLNKTVITNLREHGTYPSVEVMVQIADYLDCSLDYLLGRSDYPATRFSYTALEYNISRYLHSQVILEEEKDGTENQHLNHTAQKEA